MKYIQLEYQAKIIQDIRKQMREGKKRLLVVLPTGAGKTVVISMIAKLMSQKRKKMLMQVDRKILNSQAYSKFIDFGINVGIINAQTKILPDNDFTIGMVETIKSRIINPEYAQKIITSDCIIIDEAHKTCFDSLFEYYNENQYIIGFTATPIRQGKVAPLSKFYEDIIVGVQIPELIAINRLSKAISYGVPQDLSKVRITGGDYNERDLNAHFKRKTVYSGIIENIRKHNIIGKKVLIFSSGIESSKLLINELCAKGLNAKHIDSYMHKDDIQSIINWFDTKKDAILSNVGMLTTGFDQPDIQCVILARATTSLPLFLQMCGRGSRVCEGKSEFIILDFGNNILTHGFWQQERVWSLRNDEKKRLSKKGESVAPVKECKKCGALINMSAKVCPHCNTIVATPKKKIDKILELLDERELIKYFKQAPLIQKELYREKKGYKLGWLLRQFTSFDEFVEYGNLKNYKSEWAYLQAKRYNVG